MIASRICLALAWATAALPGLALAQTTSGDEMVVSAPRAAPLPAIAAAKPGADTAAKPLTTQEQIKAWVADAPRLDRDRPADAAGGARQIHGEAGVSVGTGGYRSAYVSSLIPIGKDGTLGIAISQTDYGNNYRGRSGYRGWGRHGGSARSVALSLDMSGDGRDTNDEANGCAPRFRDGDRYIEPLWVTRMHNNQSCDIITDRDTKASMDTSADTGMH